MADTKTTVENNEQEEVKPVDLLDVLLDKDNRDPIVLMDENGKQLTFEQVAVIPYEVKKEKRLYCVLKPLDKIENIGEDDAIVFYVDQDDNGNSILRVEVDEEVAISVFDLYYDLLEEAQKEEKAAKAKAKKATTTSTTKKSSTKVAGKATSKPSTPKSTPKK